MYVNKHQVIHSYRNLTSSLFLRHLAIAFILEAIYSYCAYIMEIMGKDLLLCVSSQVHLQWYQVVS